MTPPRLTIIPLLQSYDAATARLTLNVLLVPVGDPAQPLASTAPGAPAAPSFAGTKLELQPHVSADSGRVPTVADVPPTGASTTLVPPASQTGVFDWLRAQFKITRPPASHKRSDTFRIRKYLPNSYRRSHAFVAPRTPLASTDDTYACLLKCAPPPGRPIKPPSDDISWGEAFAIAMRQPAVARAAGLIHSVEIPLDPAFPGGWLFFTLAPGSPFAAQAAVDPDYLKLHATRIPELTQGTARSVFTATLFPVAADAAGAAAFGALDQVFPEAAAFDDGFAKIVHARQPLSALIATDEDEVEGADQPEVQIDPGIQLAWDDEDVLVGMNRGAGTEMDGSTPPDAPSAVLGYRVDVRAAGTRDWTSLTGIASSGLSLGTAQIPPFTGEMTVEVHPTTLGDAFWLPAFFTRWEGGSLTAPSDDEMLLSGPPRPRALPFEGVGADAVPLRYGRSYEFRVRLADTTGGGPDLSDTPANPAQAPVARHAFKRHVKPGPVTVRDRDGGALAVPRRFAVTRPSIQYPQAVYTDFPGAFEHLRDIARANLLAGPGAQVLPAMPDPDADYLEIAVLVAAPRFDPAGGETGYVPLYTTYRSFPALVDLDRADPVDLELEWVDCAHLTDVVWSAGGAAPGSETGPIKLPTARDVKVALRAVSRVDHAYFGSDAARHGAIGELWPGALRAPAATESALLAPTTPQERIASVFLQPDPPSAAPTRVAVAQAGPSPVLAKRLAAAVQLVADDNTLYGAPGRRTVFGCAGLRHHLSPDYGALTITSPGELERIWLNVVTVTLDRDWSWIGLAAPALDLRRRVELVPGGQISTKSLGTLSVDHAVNQQALRATPEREGVDIVFLDAMDPPVDTDGFPREARVTYELVARFANGASETIALETHLPVATPPRVAPKVVSAGLAFADYRILGDYEATAPRERMLWLELEDDPDKDPRDIYYARVLWNTPDPMLLPAYEPAADPPPYAEIDLDPETVRVIRPGQSDDFAGLSAMQPLIPAADSDRHYAVPLPAHLTSQSAELFGFFTYELRVGHPRGTAAAPFWSTAQGRFGPAFVLEGVQHPAPRLSCAVRRTKSLLAASSVYATPILNAREVGPRDPNTEVWFVLYGRIVQADGATHRNVQIDLRKGAPLRKRRSRGRTAGLPPTAEAIWKVEEIATRLDEIGFDPDTPLTALAVELLPEPNGPFDDPLCGDLGEVRILRTSNLVSIGDACCPPEF